MVNVHEPKLVDASGETTTVYKVTRAKRDGARTIYVSAVRPEWWDHPPIHPSTPERGWWEYPHRVEIVYTPDEATTAEAGKLFAFRSLDDAVAWVKYLRSYPHLYPYVIWEAEAQGVEPVSQVLDSDELATLVSPESDVTWFCFFWCLGYEEKRKLADCPDVPSYLLVNAPRGTVACDTITLRRRLDC